MPTVPSRRTFMATAFAAAGMAALTHPAAAQTFDAAALAARLVELGVKLGDADATAELVNSTRTLSIASSVAPKVTDADLAMIAGMPALHTLSMVRATLITDSGVGALGAMAKLTSLSLDASNITGTCFKALAGAKLLTRLGLNLTKITDETAQDLALLTGLESLDLTRTAITDRTLAAIGKLANLNSLGLNNTAVTDDGLKHLAGLTNLKMLTLVGTGIGDAGIAVLNPAKLEFLHLIGTKVTDAGLLQLAAFPVLATVVARAAPGVTDDGIKAALAARPANLRKLSISK